MRLYILKEAGSNGIKRLEINCFLVNMSSSVLTTVPGKRTIRAGGTDDMMAHIRSINLKVLTGRSIISTATAIW